MDDALRKQIQALAEQHGIDPARLEEIFASGAIPQELEQALATVLGDVGFFDEALKKLDS